MLALVTGGSGFVGSNLVNKLVSLGYEVWATTCPGESRLPAVVRQFSHGLTGVDFPRMGRMLYERGQAIDVLFHQAANNDTYCDDDDEMEWSNVVAADQVFDWAIKHGCRHIVYASSTAVYGNAPVPYREDGPLNPLNAYGRSKQRLELAAQAFSKLNPDVALVGLRYCNVYGPGEGHKGHRASMIYQMGRRIKENLRALLFANGEQRRDFIFVDDVVRANLLAAQATESFVVNCGLGGAVTFNRLNDILCDVMGGMWSPPEYIQNPAPEAYQSHTECDMQLAERKLGFKPEYDIEAGIRAYFERGGFK